MIEYRFRDFMVGWLAGQLRKQIIEAEMALALYEEVIEAEDDKASLAEVTNILGEGTAQDLWQQSQPETDPLEETARELVERLRDQVQADYHDLPDFYRFFLNPFKQSCVPQMYEDRLEQEIVWMFRTLYTAASAGVVASYGWTVDVVVEPSYEDASYIVVLAHAPGESQRRAFVMDRWHKAWHVRFANLYELVEQLETLRQKVAHSIQEAVLGYRVVKTITDVMGGLACEPVKTPAEPIGEATARVTIEVHGGVATVVDKPPDVVVKIIDFDTGVAHL